MKFFCSFQRCCFCLCVPKACPGVYLRGRWRWNFWYGMNYISRQKKRIAVGKAFTLQKFVQKFEVVCTWNCQRHLKCSCRKIKVYMTLGWTWNDWNSNGWLGNVLIDNVWHIAFKEEGSSGAVKIVSLPRIRLENQQWQLVAGKCAGWWVSCLNMSHLFPRGSSMAEEGLVYWGANWGNKFSTLLLIAAVSDTVL